MPLSHEHVGSKIVAKIKIYISTRAELLFNLCYEIPCKVKFKKRIVFHGVATGKFITFVRVEIPAMRSFSRTIVRQKDSKYSWL